MDFTPVNDFFSNIKDKLTNPFFGTLILVWLTRNWLLVYTIFNFDEKHNLNTKVEFIQNYITINGFWWGLVENTIISLGLMLIGYVVIIGTRALSMTVEHRIMPWVTNGVVSKNIVLKTDYDKIVEEADNYFKRYEGERNNVRKLSEDYDAMSENYKSAIKNYSELTTKHEQLENQLVEKSNIIKQTEANYQTLKRDKEKLNTEKIIIEKDRGFENVIKEKAEKDLYDTRQLFVDNDKAIDFLLNNNNILRACQELIKNNYLYNFLSTIDKLRGGPRILIPEEILQNLIKYGLMVETKGLTKLSAIGYLINKFIFKDYRSLLTKQQKELQDKIMNLELK